MGLYNPDDVYNKPSDADIKMAYRNLTYKADLKKYTSGKLLENYMKDTYRHCDYLSPTLSYRCSYRGITINHKEEITWHEFVMASLRMGLYTFEDSNGDKSEEQIPGQDDIYKDNDEDTVIKKCINGLNPYGNCVCCGKDDIKCCAECKEDCNGRCGWYMEKKEFEEQIPGQDDIYNHPEYLPDNVSDNSSDTNIYQQENNNENSDDVNVTESVTNEEQDNRVHNIQDSDRIAGVKKIGNCPHCNAPLIYISNKNFCGKCGKPVMWE